MTLAQLQAAQATAGGTYSAALAAFVAAYVDLAALDLALANPAIDQAGALPVLTTDPNSFVRYSPISAPLLAISITTLAGQIGTARDAYVAGFTAG